MYSISFPNIFSNNGIGTSLVEDHQATFSNMRLALLASKNSLLGDPEFGSLLRRRLFEQNSIILQDLIIDDVYTTIRAFVPQIDLDRKDIRVTSEGADVFVSIKCKNLLNSELDTFAINLTS